MTVDHHILSSLDWKHGFQCIIPPGFEALDSSDSYMSSRNCGLQGLDQIRGCTPKEALTRSAARPLETSPSAITGLYLHRLFSSEAGSPLTSSLLS
ncbi:hypothetical protein SRHO_G00079870 [Serrasalmus rhombeus]